MAEGMNNTSITLPTSVSDEIWAKTLEASTVMQLAQRIELPGNGLTIPVITGEPTAAWVNETDEKPVSKHTLETKEMKSYTLAIIEPFSNQFRDNKAALFDELVGRLPYAIGKKFDGTIFHDDAPGTGFDTLKGVPNHVDASAKTYDAFVDAIGKVAEADGDLNAWVLSPQAKTLLLKTKDTTNRPLFINNAQTDGSVGHVLSVPAYFTKAPTRRPSPPEPRRPRSSASAATGAPPATAWSRTSTSPSPTRPRSPAARRRSTSGSATCSLSAASSRSASSSATSPTSSASTTAPPPRGSAKWLSSRSRR